jgi:hypothetical protein
MDLGGKAMGFHSYEEVKDQLVFYLNIWPHSRIPQYLMNEFFQGNFDVVDYQVVQATKSLKGIAVLLNILGKPAEIDFVKSDNAWKIAGDHSQQLCLKEKELLEHPKLRLLFLTH